MTGPHQPPSISRFGAPRQRASEAKERWLEAGYPPKVVESLHWDRRYSIIRIGGSQFAFSGHADYVAGLREAWAACVVPDQGPASVLGIDLPDVAESLRGVDVDLSRGPPSGARSTGDSPG